jgi:hydrogenase/urease accessory protein HupE
MIRPSQQTRMQRLMQLLMALVIAICGTGAACGHEVRPALLEITERPAGHYDVLWKQPTSGALGVHLVPHLSGGLLEQTPTSSEAAPDFQISVWRNLDAGSQGLEGRTLQIEGLNRTITDVLVVITPIAGDSIQQILHPQDPDLTLHPHKTGMAVPAYLILGTMHILTGVDHLFFVLGLILLVRSRLTLVKTITAFTVAHSITLAATTLQVIAVQPALIEALVALSILFVAVEVIHAYRGENTLTARYPWLIAFVFGLLHGSAFASALVEIGLPPHAIAPALFLFNVGVELGQLLFIAGVLAISFIVRKLPTQLPPWTRWVPPYAIGAFAATWFFERLSAAVN